jgi:hypothetical protein
MKYLRFFVPISPKWSTGFNVIGTFFVFTDFAAKSPQGTLYGAEWLRTINLLVLTSSDLFKMLYTSIRSTVLSIPLQ